MGFLGTIYARVNIPIGRTTLGKLWIAAAVFLLLTTAFAYIAREVVEGETLRNDQRVLLKLNQLATPELDNSVVAITTMGDMVAVATITILLLAVLVYRKKWQAVAQVGFGLVGAGLLNFWLKVLFERDRPHLWDWVIQESTYSFPSGHAMLTSAFAFTLILLTWQTKWRWWAVCVGSCYMILIGLSRLYLGVHYPTDIVAGWCVSLAWVLIVATILGAVHWPRLLK